MTLSRILGLTAMLTFFALVAVVGTAWSNGVRFYGVESGSMSPVFGRGDLVVDVPTTADTTFRVGDVVTFHPTPGYTTTHRIVAVETIGISTKGDANATADIGQVPPSSVVGRVVAVIPFGGAVAAFFRQPAAIAALVVGILGLYLTSSLSAGRPKPAVAGEPDGEPDAVAPEPSPPADEPHV